jgi:hypothetical protein
MSWPDRSSTVRVLSLHDRNYALRRSLTPRLRLQSFAACELGIAAFALLSPWLLHDVHYTIVGAMRVSPPALRDELQVQEP